MKSTKRRMYDEESYELDNVYNESEERYQATPSIWYS